MDTRTRLLSLVTLQFGAIETTAEDVLDAVLTTDLKGDSIDRVSLIVEIEEEFKIEISDDEDAALGPDATIRTLLGLVEQKLGEKVAA